MRDMAQNEHLRESSRLAQLVQAGMRTVHPGPSRGVKQAGFRVLVTAFMPAVLVEIGFGTNRAEATYMTSPERQAELAEQLADAVVRYLSEYERKVGK
jgi:N-acetylmuramoyl-L-alanine amidase